MSSPKLGGRHEVAGAYCSASWRVIDMAVELMRIGLRCLGKFFFFDSVAAATAIDGVNRQHVVVDDGRTLDLDFTRIGLAATCDYPDIPCGGGLHDHKLFPDCKRHEGDQPSAWPGGARGLPDPQGQAFFVVALAAIEHVFPLLQRH